MEKQISPQEIKKLVMDLEQQKQEEKGRRLENKLDTIMLPMDMIPESWLELAVKARRKSSPLSHRINLKDFSKAVNLNGCSPVPQKLSIFQFAILYNSIEAVTQDQLELCDEEYEKLLKDGLPAFEWYKKTTDPLREKIEAEVNKEFEMKRAAIIGNESMKAGGFKPILGKA